MISGKVLTTIFEKPSLRTKASLEIGAQLLGGHVVAFGAHEVQIGEREPIEDVARVVSRMADGIALRVFSHQTILSACEVSDIPILNALSDLEHPCQALADLLTLKEKFGSLRGISIAFVGDGYNVARSLAYASVMSGMHIKIASPVGYQLDPVVELANSLAGDGTVFQLTDPYEAVTDVAAVYTDVWASMGQEDEIAVRAEAFASYQVNSELMSAAPPDALVMHDLPAHHGEEITRDVFEGRNSIIFDQAENRLFTTQAALKYMFNVN
ncbi:MAG TPA: ornithine carbamoyltransferase [Dehalococcoidia bacterium]|nr:ornithine carbamoyltransferase [Dehalococcoidia bacterium]